MNRTNRSRAPALLALVAGLVPADGARAGWFTETTELLIGVPAMTVATLAGPPAVALGELVGIGRHPGFLSSYLDHVADGWARAVRFDR
jgi:hypothetical protein